MLKKLRKRFICINMAIVTGMLLIIFGLFIHFASVNLENSSDAMLQRLAQHAIDPGSPDIDATLPYFTLSFNTRGEYIASGKTHYDISDRLFIDKLMRCIMDINRNTGYIEEYQLKYTVTTTPGMQVIAFLDVSSHQTTITSLVQSSLLIGAAALVAFTVISILLARWAVNPVDKAWKQQQQFVSDASHELKTPLTVIISNAELLKSSESADHPRFTDNILTSSRQMRRLVENLLELARADNGQIKTNFEIFDYSQTVAASVLPFEPVFFENNMTLESHIQPGIQLKGSILHLRQLTDILLDNARKYSDPGAVELNLYRQGRNQCVLTVSNPGFPIPQDELESIFQRFYRSDKARSNTGSFGLGLSIAQRITEEHGGQIWAESNETGNRFTVVLPCMPV